MREPRDGLPLHELAGLFPVMSAEEYGALKASMAAHGYDPAWPVVRWRGRVIDGRHRLRACAELGIEPVYADLPDGADPVEAVIRANLTRRHLSEGQRGMLAADLAQRRPGRLNASADAFTQTDAAAMFGVSRSTVQRARRVQDRAHPEVAAAVRSGEVSVSDADSLIRDDPAVQLAALTAWRQRQADGDLVHTLREAGYRARRQAATADRLARIAETARPLPTGARRYPVILADPPWQYEAGALPVTAAGGVRYHYPLMADAEIEALPVSGLAAPDAVLWLWATAPKLPEALRVMAAWGFAYRSSAVWLKQTEAGGLHTGTGYWFRGQHELLLVGRRGAFPAPHFGSAPLSVIEAARGAHSAKPAAVYAIIERLWPDLPKIELFARTPRTGWQTWGHEAPPAGAMQACEARPAPTGNR
ncbi:MAG: MT-A70 family methyltransferase [bacterium]|nr:MT-A70 family methyltransferase [bacterium]